MIDQIENQFNFKYPAIYRDLYDNQMLDWLRGWNEPWTKERNWFTEIYPTLRAHPPLLLNTHDFELIPISEVADYIDKKPEYWDPQHQFIPFGKSGSGDWYAFYLNLRAGDNVPIVFVSHDMNEAVIEASNLNDFIFRRLLEVVHFGDAKDEQQERDYRDNLRLTLASHKRYLSAEKVILLENIYNKPINSYSHRALGDGSTYYEYGMLPAEEIDLILENEIGLSRLGDEFGYQKDSI